MEKNRTFGQLFLFYVIFYIILAILFAICMQGLLASVDDYKPKWQLEESLIGTNPGLGFRPLSEQTERGSVIEFDNKKPAEIEYWTGLLDDFLKDYKQTEGRKMKHCDYNQSRNPNDVCVVDENQFGPCSSANGYGYRVGKPCIFLKLNKIYGWVPEIYDTPALNMPDDLQHLFNQTSEVERQKIWISCNGHYGKDKEQFQNISYYPSQGIPTYYYPYLNQPGYLSPIVAVQFNSPPIGSMLDVECRAWAKNIIYSGSIRDRMGSVTFQFLMD
ncbi:sodium/potassium-transporting ATPase subunit beta-1 isoform X2 [Drosophila albomicans]|uniref:Sodium/potassium-transporting ATPase subunit beta-1 isoform X2 n=1 Tax=Drosophila albomicans TaxID=7291 RepID=A0A9C6STJ0_DROAB|nr:sodium/potassium-transporting ATPase subunit beta-1 isoform X2 [Drosophila albomicans]